MKLENLKKYLLSLTAFRWLLFAAFMTLLYFDMENKGAFLTVFMYCLGLKFIAMAVEPKLKPVLSRTYDAAYNAVNSLRAKYPIVDVIAINCCTFAISMSLLYWTTDNKANFSFIFWFCLQLKIILTAAIYMFTRREKPAPCVSSTHAIEVEVEFIDTDKR